MSKPSHISLPEAAGVLHLPVEGVQALVGAGYLRPTAEEADGPRFALGDLKALLARLDDGNDVGEPQVDLTYHDELDPQVLLDAIGLRSDDMARRALDVLRTVFADAAGWRLRQQAEFIAEAKARFEAIVAVASLGDEAGQALLDDLALVGGDAAHDGTSLPEVLLVLRISRDMVVQTAIEVAEERGRQWGLALSLVLTRVLPSIDRLTDAISRGYWEAVITDNDE
jgi:hypothetical protein